MSRALKVFRGNFDGRLEAIVAAPSQKVAADLVGSSLHSFRDYYQECTAGSAAAAVAMQAPGVVFVRKMLSNDVWERANA